VTGGQVTAGSASKLTPLEVEHVVRTGYGFRVESQKRLGGEIDQNVWVRTDDGSQYLFKASVGEVDEVLLWQQTVLSHLERAAPDIPVSRLVLTQSGEGMLALELGGRHFVVRLLSWLPGSMLAELDDVPLHLPSTHRWSPASPRSGRWPRRPSSRSAGSGAPRRLLPLPSCWPALPEATSTSVRRWGRTRAT
jgi:hypothetical protein